MKKYPKRLKIALMLFCTAIAAIVYTSYYFHAKSKMTAWQQAQTIDFDAQTGSTKFKAHIDSAIFAGLAFSLSAICTIITYKKFSNKK